MQKLLNINRYGMYLLLVIAVSIPLFIPNLVVPTLTTRNTQDLYIALNKLPEGSTVLLESDWTVSTRGESAGQLEALLKIMHRRKTNFVLFSAADPQAPLVAKNVLNRVNAELEKEGLEPFKPWEDYLELGFFPDAEAFWQTVAVNPRKVFAGKTSFNPALNQERDVYESPVLANIRTPKDIGMIINVSASGTLDIIVQRMSGKGAPIGAMLTGVMAPEAMVYVNSGQIVGLSAGLRGVVELETMMARGVNFSSEGQDPFVKAPQFDGIIEPLPKEYGGYGRGMKYFGSLHAALTLLILAVVLGNIGLYAQKKGGRKS